MFAQTTHVVAAPHGFACVGIPTTWLYIPSFIEIRLGVLEPPGGPNLAFPITSAIVFYNSLYKRTSRDTCVCTLRGEFRDFVGNGTIDRQTQTVGMLILAKVIPDTA